MQGKDKKISPQGRKGRKDKYSVKDIMSMPLTAGIHSNRNAVFMDPRHRGDDNGVYTGLVLAPLR
jgi:hypothetical protein